MSPLRYVGIQEGVEIRVSWTFPVIRKGGPLHTTERQLAEHGDKVDEATKAEIESAIGEAKAAVEGGDVAAMTEKGQALAQAAMKLGQAIYEKEQAAAASPEADAPKDDDVVDAEFSEVDENKG